MQLSLADVIVVNNEEAHRFEATYGGQLALLAYRRFPGEIVLEHAEVPPPLERKGLAAKLTRVALEFARAYGLRVVPQCPYVAAYMRKHPEEQDLLSPADRKRIQSGPTNAADK